MIKYFCDNCEEELNSKNKFNSKTFGHKGINIKVIITNVCEVCKYCVYDAVKKLDDRPTDVSK